MGLIPQSFNSWFNIVIESFKDRSVSWMKSATVSLLNAVPPFGELLLINSMDNTSLIVRMVFKNPF